MKLVVKVLVVVVALFVLIQLVPYGRSHKNPRGASQPTFTSAKGEQLVRVSCYDCHSNETKWPWYTNIAPVSWWSQNHVDEGRNTLNFSDWGNAGKTDDLAEVVQEGSMPPTYYTLLHAEARLSSADKQTLIEELRAIAGTAGGGGERRGGGDD